MKTKGWLLMKRYEYLLWYIAVVVTIIAIVLIFDF